MKHQRIYRQSRIFRIPARAPVPSLVHAREGTLSRHELGQLVAQMVD